MWKEGHSLVSDDPYCSIKAPRDLLSAGFDLEEIKKAWDMSI
jgi:hypothetical protein